MQTSLLKPFERLELLKEKILRDVSSVSNEKYHFPENGKWSLAQILTHILTSEQLALAYMRKKSLGIETLDDSGFIEPLKLFLLQVSQRIPFKYRAPKAIVEKTPPPMTLKDLSWHWSVSRSDLKNFLETIPAHHAKRKIFKHPIAGMFNAAQGVAFLGEHLLHHKPQIERLLK